MENNTNGDDLNKLYKSVTSQGFDVGDENSFRLKMSTPESRRKFYDLMSSRNISLGDYNTYEKRLSGVKPVKPVPQKDLPNVFKKPEEDTSLANKLSKLKAPKQTVIEQLQEEALTKPKVGETVKPKTVAESMKQAQDLKKKPAPVQPKGEAMQASMENYIDRYSTEKKYEQPRYTPANPEEHQRVDAEFKDLSTVGIDNEDFTNFLKNKTSYFDHKIDHTDKTVNEYELNNYINKYLVDRDKYLSGKVVISNPQERARIAQEAQKLGAGYEEYKKQNLPNLVQAEKEKVAENKKIYEEVKSGNRSTLDDIKKIGESTFTGFLNSVGDLMAATTDAVGLKEFGRNYRTVKEYDQWKNSSPVITFEQGKPVDYKGNKYIVTDNGMIIDRDTKTMVNSFIGDKKAKEILDLSNKSKSEKESVYSGRGFLYAGGGVLGNLVTQLYAGSALRGGLGTLGVTGRTTAIATDMIGVGAIVGSNVYNDTVTELENQGISEDQAKPEATKVALITSAASMFSQRFLNNSATRKLLDGSTSMSRLVSKAIAATEEGGYQNLGKRIVGEIYDVAKEAGIEGTKEAIQENFENYWQKAGNAAVNLSLGRKVLDSDYTTKDLVDNTILSFAVSSLTGAIGSATHKDFAGIPRADLINILASDPAKFQQTGQDMVDQNLIKQKDFDQLRSEVENVAKYADRIPKTVSEDKANQLMNKFAERDNLEAQKKEVDKAFHEPINEKLSKVNEEIETIIKTKDEPKTTETESRLQEDVTRPEEETKDREAENRQTEEVKQKEPESTVEEPRQKESPYAIKDEAVIKRLKDEGVAEEVIQALPENFHINDKWLMGDKGESLLSRVRKTIRNGGVTFINFETDGEGKMTDYDTGRVDINNFSSKIFGKKNILYHEAVHAATIMVMEDMRVNRDQYSERELEAYDNIKSDFEYIKKLRSENKKINTEGVNMYGMTNMYEFMAEFMSNKKFREWVADEAKQSDRPFNTLKVMWDNILKLLGVIKNKVKIDESYINEVTSDINSIMESQKKKYEEIKQAKEARKQKVEETATPVETRTAPQETEESIGKINLSEELGINKLNDILDKWDKDLTDFGKGNLSMGLPITVAKVAVKAMKVAAKTAKTGADVISAGLKAVKETQWYKNLNTEDKARFDRDGLVRSLNETSTEAISKATEAVIKPSEVPVKKKSTKQQVREETGQTDVSKKITMTEKQLLKKQIRDIEQGSKLGAKEIKSIKAGLINYIKEEFKGITNSIGKAKASQLLNQVKNLNEKNAVDIYNKVDEIISKIKETEQSKGLKSMISSLRRSARSKGKMTPATIKQLAKEIVNLDYKYLEGADLQEFRDIVSKVQDVFRAVTSDKYEMIDSDSINRSIDRLREAIEQAKSQELADLLGIDGTGLTSKELAKMLQDQDLDNEAKKLSEERRQALKDKLIAMGEYSRMGLENLPDDSDRFKNDYLKALKRADMNQMSMEGIKQYIKVADNIIMNNDYSNAGLAEAFVLSGERANIIKQYISDNNIKVDKIDTESISSRVFGMKIPILLDMKDWAKQAMFSFTTLNVMFDRIFGSSKHGAKLYKETGFFDLSTSKINSVKESSQFQTKFFDKMNDLAKNNKALLSGEQIIRRSALATLLQADINNEENMIHFKENYIQASIDNLYKYKGDKQSENKARILEGILDELSSIRTKEELIEYLKQNDNANYTLLKLASDEFLKITDRLERNTNVVHGLVFEPKTEEDFYLPLNRASLKPKELRQRLDEARATNNYMMFKTSGKTGAVESRLAGARLGDGETINFNFDSSVVNSYGEQVYDINSAQAILNLKHLMSNPTFVESLGSAATELGKRAINKIAMDSGTAMNSTSSIENKIAKTEQAYRKIASILGLGGVDQYMKQYPSVLLGAAIRLGADADVLMHYMFRSKADIGLIEMSSIQARGEMLAGTKRASDDIRYDDLSLDGQKKVNLITKEIARSMNIGLEKARDLAMYSLVTGDKNVALTTFLGYYHAYLRGKGIKNIDMRLEHTRIQEGDQVRADALAYATHMVNTTQMSSDLTEGAPVTMSTHAAAKILANIFMPFSSFSNNAAVRLMTHISRGALTHKDGLKEVGASLGEIIAFQGIKTMVLAPLGMYAVAALMGGSSDDEDDEAKEIVDWSKQATKWYSSAIGDLLPTPDAIDIDAMNWMVYQYSKVALKDKLPEDVNNFARFMKWAKDANRGKDRDISAEESPFLFYRYNDRDGFDILSGSSIETGMYTIPIDQAKRMLEAWNAVIDNEIQTESKYGKTETYKFDDEYKNFLIYYSLMETASVVGASEAYTRRLSERYYEAIKKKSKVSSAEKKREQRAR